MNWLRKIVANQMVDNSGVVPEQKWCDRERCFYLNSPAGLIRYKPITIQDTARFRDEYINRFDNIAIVCSDKKHMIKKYFKLYHEIRSKERVRYTANANTRLKGKLCNLI